MFGHVPALPLGVDPLIAEAKQRARRRRLLVMVAAGFLLASAAAGVTIATGNGGGESGAIPWLPTRPNLGPAHPPLAPPCTASQLSASLSLQGATMSLVGPISLVNRSSQPCSLLGHPKLSFAGATSRWEQTRFHGAAAIPFDPLAPPRGSLRALAPGKHVAIQLWWSNWCGTGAKPGGSDTQPPAAMVLTAPGGGTIQLRNELNRRLEAPVCNGGAGSLSTLQASRYTPFVPQGPPSSALPLKARIVSPSSLTARAGGWFDYTVVLTNTSRRTFTFGPGCPAYIEGMGDTENEAYLLNCHGVGSIAPKQSVRFAMRVGVPAHPNGSSAALGWTLAPHSWNAPQTFAVVRIH